MLFRSETAPMDFTGKRLLLAEDNELNAELAVELLGQMGFRVDVAEDGAKALAAVEAPGGETYNGILMDLQMPNMDGLEAARRIRALPDKRRASVPIIAMTADAFQESRQAALDAGMDAHVIKPIEPWKLAETLRKLLR